MRHLYYIIQTLLRGRGGNLVKLTSLTLGLLVGILLFSQIAYELSYENFYKDPERLVVLRMREVRDGIPNQDYNYGTYRPAAADLWEALPEQVECATLTSGFWQSDLYKDDKKLEAASMLCVDTLYFRTTGVEVLRGDPHDLGVMQNAFISQGMARRVFGDEDPIGKELSVGKMFNVTIRGIYRDVPQNTIFPADILLSIAVMDWGYGVSTWGMNNIYGVLFRLKQESDVAVMNQRVQKAVEQYTDPHLGESVVTEYSVIPVREIYRSFPDVKRKLVIMGVLGFSIFFVSIMNYVLAAIASMSRRAKVVGVHKCSGAGEGRILGMFLWETGLLILVSIVACLLLMYLFGERIEDMLDSRLADLFTWQNLYVPLLTVLLLFVVAGVLPGAYVCPHPRDAGVSPLYGGQAFVEAWVALCAVCGHGFHPGDAAHYGVAISGGDEPQRRIPYRAAGSGQGCRGDREECRDRRCHQEAALRGSGGVQQLYAVAALQHQPPDRCAGQFHLSASLHADRQGFSQSGRAEALGRHMAATHR